GEGRPQGLLGFGRRLAQLADPRPDPGEQRGVAAQVGLRDVDRSQLLGHGGADLLDLLCEHEAPTRSAGPATSPPSTTVPSAMPPPPAASAPPPSQAMVALLAAAPLSEAMAVPVEAAPSKPTAP
ncbi:MAG TPA: hypothetical protein VGE07_28855, partial [Herpetosiphonaceae bacterium]